MEIRTCKSCYGCIHPSHLLIVLITKRIIVGPSAFHTVINQPQLRLSNGFRCCLHAFIPQTIYHERISKNKHLRIIPIGRVLLDKMSPLRPSTPAKVLHLHNLGQNRLIHIILTSWGREVARVDAVSTSSPRVIVWVRLEEGTFVVVLLHELPLLFGLLAGFRVLPLPFPPLLLSHVPHLIYFLLLLKHGLPILSVPLDPSNLPGLPGFVLISLIHIVIRVHIGNISFQLKILLDLEILFDLLHDNLFGLLPSLFQPLLHGLLQRLLLGLEPLSLGYGVPL
ncbi:zinc finger C3HC4-type RING finger family protein [Striga asiatica]|uniref:Zinc finger C3HC4-type RING finger family protein n=1 Tax=Striga asiatica TaxID=4170 RepID=A0A5A7QN33_STRAF|nr:zinc finger C3HC4-type RING finger family protein [Striga asiatica]